MGREMSHEPERLEARLSKAKKPFTVVLLRPEYVTEEFGTDVYVAMLPDAKDEYDAVDLAGLGVLKAEKKDKMIPRRPEDYKMVLVFEGIQNPNLFGFSIRQ